jgi:hypothetical protein
MSAHTWPDKYSIELLQRRCLAAMSAGPRVCYYHQPTLHIAAVRWNEKAVAFVIPQVTDSF